jgi:hypothetical protein
MSVLGGMERLLGRTRLGKVLNSLTRLDRLTNFLLPYVAMTVVGVMAVYIYFRGSSVGFDVIMEAAGIALGILAVYFMYIKMGQEKSLQFFDGEDVLLKSSGEKTYLVIPSVGDADIPLEPIKANLYLTNLGIIAEKHDAGEATVFISLDGVKEYAAYQRGIRIRYVDPRYSFAEAMLYVDDRDAWIQKLNEIFRSSWPR